MYTIYKHTNTITNKSYIGLTKYTVKKRFNQHKKDAFRYRNGKLPSFAFYNAIRKHGTTCWTSEILEENLSYENANIREQYYIKYFNTYAKGYNSTIGGDHKFPESVRVKGENHHQADTKIYTFYHVDGSVFTGNKFQFMTTVFGEITRSQHVKDAVSKRRRSEADQTLRNWINSNTGTIEYSTKSIDLRDKYSLNISHLKRITDGKQLQHKGWKLYVEKS